MGLHGTPWDSKDSAGLQGLHGVLESAISPLVFLPLHLIHSDELID
jgi:hypothetical protein